MFYLPFSLNVSSPLCTTPFHRSSSQVALLALLLVQNTKLNHGCTTYYKYCFQSSWFPSQTWRSFMIFFLFCFSEKLCCHFSSGQWQTVCVCFKKPLLKAPRHIKHLRIWYFLIHKQVMSTGKFSQVNWNRSLSWFKRCRDYSWVSNTCKESWIFGLWPQETHFTSYLNFLVKIPL